MSYYDQIREAASAAGYRPSSDDITRERAAILALLRKTKQVLGCTSAASDKLLGIDHDLACKAYDALVELLDKAGA